MSVGTHVTGRNLAAYRSVRIGADLEVLVTPALFELASLMRIATKGVVFPTLTVELSGDDGPGGSCV